MSDSFWLIADTPHHMRPAGTMMPKDQGESIPSLNTDAHRRGFAPWSVAG
jgi:hypothetical protein